MLSIVSVSFWFYSHLNPLYTCSQYHVYVWCTMYLYVLHMTMLWLKQNKVTYLLTYIFRSRPIRRKNWRDDKVKHYATSPKPYKHRQQQTAGRRLAVSISDASEINGFYWVWGVAGLFQDVGSECGWLILKQTWVWNMFGRWQIRMSSPSNDLDLCAWHCSALWSCRISKS